MSQETSAPQRPRRSRHRGRSARRILRLLSLVIGSASLVAVSSAPAGAVTMTENFDGLMVTVDFNVNGTYQPLPLACGSASHIFWYGPGAAPDAFWRNLDLSGPTVTYTNAGRAVNGTFHPFTGDFDGNGCEDIFWYGHGGAADYIWFFRSDGSFISQPVSVGGNYVPVVTWFNDDGPQDILWYAPGSGRETIWLGSSSRRMTSKAAPQVNGTYDPAPFGDGAVLWYGPGAAKDFVTEISAGRTTPDASYNVAIDGSFQNHWFGPFPVLYDAAGTDYVVGDLGDPVGGVYPLMVLPGEITTTTYASSATQLFAVLHQPGAGTDQLMLLNPAAFGASTTGAVIDGGAPPTDGDGLALPRGTALIPLPAG